MPNALLQLTYHELERRRLLSLVCAGCKHGLGLHSTLGHCSGNLGGKSCKCKAWKDPAEQLALK